MKDDPYIFDEEGLPVKLISGAEFKVLTTDEVRYLSDRISQYTANFRWDNVSDLQDVDRILILELLSHRYGLFLSRGRDYVDDPVDENNLRKSLNDFSGEIRQVKKSLGMDRVSREKERGDDSVSAYLENLRQRAMEFGITRNKEAEVSRTLAHQLIALYQLMMNCDEQERVEQQCRPQDIIKWIETDFIPKFEELDIELRKSQKYWISKI